MIFNYKYHLYMFIYIYKYINIIKIVKFNTFFFIQSKKRMNLIYLFLN
jgi:hypothetical protein